MLANDLESLIFAWHTARNDYDMEHCPIKTIYVDSVVNDTVTYRIEYGPDNYTYTDHCTVEHTKLLLWHINAHLENPRHD